MKDNVFEKALKLLKENFDELKEECSGEPGTVGGGWDFKFSIEEKKYTVRIDAFWEKQDWFEYSIKGENNDYEKSGMGDR